MPHANGVPDEKARIPLQGSREGAAERESVCRSLYALCAVSAERQMRVKTRVCA